MQVRRPRGDRGRSAAVPDGLVVAKQHQQLLPAGHGRQHVGQESVLAGDQPGGLPHCDRAVPAGLQRFEQQADQQDALCRGSSCAAELPRAVDLWPPAHQKSYFLAITERDSTPKALGHSAR